MRQKQTAVWIKTFSLSSRQKYKCHVRQQSYYCLRALQKLACPGCLRTQPEPSVDSFESADSGLRNTGIRPLS